MRGFRLAGVEGQVVTTSAEAGDALKNALAQPALGVLVLTGPVADGIREQVEKLRLERDQPLLVEIPGPAGPLPDRKSLIDLVHSAIGISLEKKGP